MAQNPARRISGLELRTGCKLGPILKRCFVRPVSSARRAKAVESLQGNKLRLYAVAPDVRSRNRSAGSELRYKHAARASGQCGSGPGSGSQRRTTPANARPQVGAALRSRNSNRPRFAIPAPYFLLKPQRLHGMNGCGPPGRKRTGQRRRAQQHGHAYGAHPGVERFYPDSAEGPVLQGGDVERGERSSPCAKISSRERQPSSCIGTPSFATNPKGGTSPGSPDK